MSEGQRHIPEVSGGSILRPPYLIDAPRIVCSHCGATQMEDWGAKGREIIESHRGDCPWR